MNSIITAKRYGGDAWVRKVWFEKYRISNGFVDIVCSSGADGIRRWPDHGAREQMGGVLAGVTPAGGSIALQSHSDWPPPVRRRNGNLRRGRQQSHLESQILGFRKRCEGSGNEERGRKDAGRLPALRAVRLGNTGRPMPARGAGGRVYRPSPYAGRRTSTAALSRTAFTRRMI